MKILFSAFALMVASPALAQTAPTGRHPGNSGPAKPAAAASTACTPEHAAMGHCTLPKAAAANAAPRSKAVPKPVGKADAHAAHKKTPTK